MFAQSLVDQINPAFLAIMALFVFGFLVWSAWCLVRKD